MARPTLHIAFLHLAPIPGDLIKNRRAIENAITRAAQKGATWIITPELSVCGYTFADTLGTDWIEPQPDQWVSSLCRLAARLRVTLFLSHPERDRKTDTLYNSLFVITADNGMSDPIARSTPFASVPKPGRVQEIVLNRLHSHPSAASDS